MWDSLHTAIDKCISVVKMVKNLPAMQETQVRSLGRKDPLEKGVATHSSILAWTIPWTEEPGGLQSVGSQRVEHDWGTNTTPHHQLCLCTRSLSQKRLSGTPWTVVRRAPLSMGFPGRNTEVGCYFLLQGIFLARDQIWLASPALAGKFFTTVPLGKP